MTELGRFGQKGVYPNDATCVYMVTRARACPCLILPIFLGILHRKADRDGSSGLLASTEHSSSLEMRNPPVVSPFTSIDALLT